MFDTDFWGSAIGAHEVVFRLSAATFVGGALGLDRELRGKPAGLRTHALVSLGSALVTVNSLEFLAPPGIDHGAITRTIQGIIAGVGFLGGGAILKAKDRDDVRGLTTAASIWLAASLGISCGAGFWISSLVALLLAVVVLVVGSPLERFVHRELKTRKGNLMNPPTELPPPPLPED